MTDPVSQPARKIIRRRQAYRMLFMDGDKLSPLGELVLSDLKKFCRGGDPVVVVSPISGMVDTHASMVAAGRQEVWQRIMAHLKLDDSDILNLKGQSDD